LLTISLVGLISTGFQVKRPEQRIARIATG